MTAVHFAGTNYGIMSAETTLPGVKWHWKWSSMHKAAQKTLSNYHGQWKEATGMYNNYTNNCSEVCDKKKKQS